jgi:hypothetical protein|tara:strand:- start:815 stop:1015 length:201 start_codon:yes stop_codon:yes gene_type:complete
MIDYLFYKFFGTIDKILNKIEKIFLPKEKIKRRHRCKICGCKCHCKDVFHNHFYDGDICTCDTCRH